jgi:hypothetical protein
MAGFPDASARPEPQGRSSARQNAVGIYGTIVTAAILASAGDRVSAPDLALSIVITLFVYWVAEEYSTTLGEQLTGGHLPTWLSVRASLATTWRMVSASFLPLPCSGC